MYSVETSQRAQKFLEKLDSHIKERLKTKLKELSKNPFPRNAKFIKRQNGNKVFRYRIGSYRALYIVLEKEKIVLITKIDKRPRVYF